MKLELVYLKQCNVIWLNKENPALGGSDWQYTVVRMQLKCRVRWRFVNEPGIRERYERYISKAVIDGTINNTPISFDAIYSVCALPELSKDTELFSLQYTLNEETRRCLRQEWDNLRWNIYYPRCRRCFCPGLCYSCTIPSIYESEHVQWEDRCATAATIYVGVHTLCLTL